jgi:hypothetical protein
MNSVSIELNNRAVAYLQSGNIVQAFELLTKASRTAMKGVTNHTHDVDPDSSTFRFHWEEDCSEGGISNKSPSFSWEGSTPFLFLRTLRVSVSDDVDVDELCPCGYAWAIWYNLAICCSVIGTRLGERGQKLLETAFDLYCRVQRQIDNEPSSTHWDLLQMAVINNQACIYHDYGMGAETRDFLEQLALIVVKSRNFESDDKTRDFFVFNLLILGTESVASAA